MRCPKCTSLNDRVVDSRLSRDGATIRRRRECLHCGTRFTTYEQIERIELRVIKRDGRHEPFDKQKLINSLLKACEKRPIGISALEKAADSILHELESGEEREISSKLIGAMAMDKLHALDPIAYVRYASVYRQFQEIGDFLEEIQYLERRPPPSSSQPELFPR